MCNDSAKNLNKCYKAIRILNLSVHKCDFEMFLLRTCLYRYIQNIYSFSELVTDEIYDRYFDVFTILKFNYNQITCLLESTVFIISNMYCYKHSFL